MYGGPFKIWTRAKVHPRRTSSAPPLVVLPIFASCLSLGGGKLGRTTKDIILGTTRDRKFTIRKLSPCSYPRILE